MFRTWALCDSDDGGCGSAGHGGDGIRLWCIAEVVDGDFCTCYVRLFREFGHYDKTNLLKCPWMCVCF